MVDRLLHFIIYNKVYVISGLILLALLFVPTKERISSGTKKVLYLLLVAWILAFAYRIGTGDDIVHLFDKDVYFVEENKPPAEIKGSPFQKYYSNDSGRKAKE